MNIKQTLEIIKKNEKKIGTINELVASKEEEFKKFIQQADKKRSNGLVKNYVRHCYR